MKILHIPGDWAAPIAFTLAAAGTFLRHSVVSSEYFFPGENLIALTFLAVAGFLTVAAVRGRSIEDSATSYYCNGGTTSFYFVAFGTAFLFLGIFSLMWILQLQDWGGRIWGLVFGPTFLWLAYTFLLKVHIVIFNADKTFLIMQGKPWSFTHHYKASDFQSLSVGIEYFPGYRRSRRLYCTYAVNGEKKILLLRDSSIEKSRETVKNITRLTGLKLVGEEPQ